MASSSRLWGKSSPQAASSSSLLGGFAGPAGSVVGRSATSSLSRSVVSASDRGSVVAWGSISWNPHSRAFRVRVRLGPGLVRSRGFCFRSRAKCAHSGRNSAISVPIKMATGRFSTTPALPVHRPLVVLSSREVVG